MLGTTDQSCMYEIPKFGIWRLQYAVLYNETVIIIYVLASMNLNQIIFLKSFKLSGAV